MNCPSRTDYDFDAAGWNQSPPALAADTTTRSDLNGIANSRQLRDHRIDLRESCHDESILSARPYDMDKSKVVGPGSGKTETGTQEQQTSASRGDLGVAAATRGHTQDGLSPPVAAGNHLWKTARTIGRVLQKYSKFVGPGFMISVAYIDPGTLTIHN